VAAVGRALAHLKYIQHRPGEDREPGGREFFDELEDRLDDKALRRAIKEQQDSRVVVHKLTLAPEINPEDKRQFTREVMERLSSEKGLDLKWMAVEHNNTRHHHIHVVVLGKDKNGKDVRFDKRDYDRIKEYGDRYLERWHPLELERSRAERERKERERIEQRTKERELERMERIREGLELSYFHRKIVREQLEPYEKWKDKPREEKKQPGQEQEKPYFQDTIEAAGKEWGRQNTLDELRELNSYLWDNPEERIAKPEYKKLVGWIKDKERLAQRVPELKDDGVKDQQRTEKPEAQRTEKDKDYFEYQGKKYSKNSPYEKLAGLAEKLRDKKAERLPIDDYQKLRGWIERADRARWSGVIEKQLELSKKQYGKEGAKKTMPDAHRFVDPVQQQVMKNPVVGLFVSGASVVNELVKWIPLTDQRDRLKEAGDAMEEAKRDKHKESVKPGRKPEDKARDKESIDKLDEAIEENKREQEERKKEKKRKQKKRDNPFSRDQWGRW
jgi:type IV secretory pathway VirD2 relaxase